MSERKPLPRYRGRKEWNGIEVFDRYEGRVLPVVPSAPGDCEPVIDTPYPKTNTFASAPRRVYWELTRRCNLECKACFNRFFAGGEELSAPVILDIARQLYAAGVYEIRCTGGEPTARPGFFELVEEFARMGFYLSMGTNGVYSPGVLQKVLDSPIHWVILSIDGSDETVHARMRGPGNFSRTLNTLEQLAAKDCRVRINTLIRKGHYTYEHLKGLAQIGDRFGVESLNCIPMRPMTHDPAALQWQLTPVEFREFIRGLEQLREEHQVDFVTTLDLRHTHGHDRVYQKDRSCAAGREGAVISPYGEVYGCSYSVASDPSAPAEERAKYIAGNLREEPFLEIWNRGQSWEIFRDLETYKHPTCRGCDYYISRRCIGNCPIMDRSDPGAFDPYCYLHVDDKYRENCS